MILPKPTLSQFATVLTITGLLVGWFISYSSKVEETRKNHEATLIKQHDQDQRLDSIVTAFAVFVSEFRGLQKDRVNTTKQRDQEKKEDDERTEAIATRLTTLETKFDDFLFYKLKNKP